jgi:hypothetical protein
MRLASLPRKSRMQREGEGDALKISSFEFIVPYPGPISCEDETRAPGRVPAARRIVGIAKPMERSAWCIFCEYPAQHHRKGS